MNNLFLIAVDLFFVLFISTSAIHIRHLPKQGPKLNGFGSNSVLYGRWPPVRNIALNAIVTANGTCGMDKIEEFCKLSDREGRARRSQFRKNRCSICEANSSDLSRRHSVDFLVDGTDRWWQSTSLYYGDMFEQVAITITFREVYQVVYIIVKAANAPRPGNWVLERSLDGENYIPWQYYAINDAECEEIFGIPATTQKPYYKTDTDVICTSQYSKLYPLENGEIYTSLINGRPGLNQSSHELLEFTKALSIRLRFLSIRAKMEPSKRWTNAGLRKKSLFYSIAEIIVGGQCDCNGHAVKADLDLASGLCQCNCEHNTCGRNCDECCPSFNWSPYMRYGGQCDSCNCNGHADRCYYDPKIGGVCINCTDNTTGFNCEKCLEGYYRIVDECIPCNCNAIGSANNYCNQSTGVCTCNEEFSGLKCDQCSSSSQVFPNCKKCQCNLNGSLNNNCERNCSCKENVEGALCDKCKEGYFGFNIIEISGKCLRCYCKDHSKICHGMINGDRIWQQTTTKISRTSLENWTISDLHDKLKINPTFDTETKWISIASLDTNEFDDFYYWKAPQEYLGDNLVTYGSWFEFETNWVAMRGDSSGRPTLGSDIIFKGANGIIVASKSTLYYGNSVKIRIQLIEDNFKFLTFNNKTLTRSDLMEILGNLTQILLRAKFYSDQLESSLESVQWNIGDNFQYLEQCQCPVNRAGQWCQECAYGYKEISCQKCDCNNHSRTCEDDGSCLCEHNTIGERCERCTNGFYGNPLLGSPDDCKRCACPLLNDENNFSPNCQSDGFGNYICTQCPTGYVGDHCEVCDYGYYGSPNKQGSKCTKCDCGFNLDCDKTTGHCLSCPGNTTGVKCERCKDFHYGDANSLNCTSCACYRKGSITLECHETTGQCLCKENYIGRACDRCEVGYAGIEVGCVKCNCNTIGSKSLECDALYGKCECRDNVVGNNCDKCKDFHYEFGVDGCKGCNCNINGSLSMACDIVTGKCQCKANVVGLKCDNCQWNHWNLQKGCIKCDCDEHGTESCDLDTGACICKVGVGGQQCSKCLPNFFNFSQNGCLNCENCIQRPGHICDPDTGRCICPKNSYGSTCQLCSANTWGLIPYIGCKKCNCSLAGSIKLQCDSTTGKCECRNGYEGDTCNKCAFGNFGYPKCRPCLCNFSGTDEKTCDYDKRTCGCNSLGRCLCKVNVVGEKCESCSHDSFNNSEKCIKCFCFGRSTNCTNAKYLWNHIRLNSSREFSLFYGDNYVDEQQIEIISQTMPAIDEQYSKSKRRLIPGFYGDVKIRLNYVLVEPFYWKLPTEFLGDKLLSYGGYMLFTLQQIGGRGFDFGHDYPLVEIMGNGDNVIQYFEINPNRDSNFEVDHNVRMHEHLWHLKDKKWDVISRETFMLILQKIQYVIIKASNAANFHKVLLKNVRLDAANLLKDVHVSIAPENSSFIELCECPVEYSASSCQNPRIGFYRWFNPESVVNGTIIIKSLGESKRCDCNGRSNTCDIETGHCLNCTRNTSGSKCQYCAIGYYGSPDNGCYPCPCPDSVNNVAETCYRSSKNEFVCKCLSGYKGNKCNECSFGYYRTNMSKCEPCACDYYGSFYPETCDVNNGQCKCRQGVIGRQCDTCELQKHFLDYGHCKVCDNCTLWLFDAIELMARNLQDFDEFLDKDKSYLIIIPIKKLMEHKQTEKNLRHVLNQWINFNNFLDLSTVDSIEKSLNDTIQKFNNLHDNMIKMRKNLNKFTKNSFRIRKLVSDLLDEKNLLIFDQIDRDIKASSFNTYKIVADIEKLINFIDEQYVTNILNDAKAMKYRSQDFANIIKKKPEVQILMEINSIKNNLNDLSKKIVQNNTNKIAQKLDKVHQKIKLIKTKLNDLQNIQNDLNSLQENLNFSETSERIRNMSNVLNDQSFQDKFIRDIEDSVRDLEIREEVLDRVNYDYKKSFADRALMHVEKLETKANDIKQALNITNQTNIALKAENIYTNIANSVQKAFDDVTDLQKLYKEKEMLLNPKNELSLYLKSKDFLKESEDVKNETQLLLRKLHDVKRKKDRLEIDMGIVIDTIWSIGSADNDIVSKLADLKEAKSHKGNVIELVQNYTKILDDVRTILKQTNDITNDVNYKLRPKYVKIREFNDTVLSLADEKATEAQSNLRVSNDALLRLEMTYEQNEDAFQKFNKSFAVNLSELQNLIKQAKQTASGIKVSLKCSPNGNCARSFKFSKFGPSIINRISIVFIFSTDHDNGTLFFVSGNVEKNEFMAIDIWKRKVRFLWNLGTNTGIVVSDQELNVQNETDKDWYQIVAERVANRGKLTVKKKYEKIDDSVKISVSSDQRITFNTQYESRIYIGDIPKSYRKNNPELQQIPNLVGCIHELGFDNENIGLWNFLSSTKNCEGCPLMSGLRKSVANNMYYFNGEGYSVKDRDQLRPYKSNRFSISLTFKTFDENSLLFLAVDKKNQRFVSIHLKNGHVIFKVKYDSETELSLETQHKYNKGQRVKITAARVFDRKHQEHARFTVNSEELNSAPITKFAKSEFPNLHNSSYYFGGLSPNSKLELDSDIEKRHFLGCLGDVLVDDIGYNLLDSNFAYGINDMCFKQEPNIVGFYGKGYVQMEPKSLKKNSISLLFRTKQLNALILKCMENRHMADKHVYYMLILSKGDIVLKLNAGRGEVQLKSKNNNYNDGNFHSITIYKNGRIIELIIDDELHDTKTLPHHSQVIIEKGNGFLYLGGLPNSSEFNTNLITNTDFVESLYGAIKDFVYDNEYFKVKEVLVLLKKIEERVISFNNVLDFEHADIGRLGPEFISETEQINAYYYHENLINVSEIVPKYPKNILNDKSNDVFDCRNSEILHSNMESNSILLKNTVLPIHVQKGFWNKNYTIKFEMRTFQENCLLLLITNSKTDIGDNKKRNYVLLMIREAKLTIVMKVRKRKEISVSRWYVSDGQWHSILIQNVKRKFSISIDGDVIFQEELPKKPFPRSGVYIGGKPNGDRFVNKLINNNILDSYSGCIRNLKFNQKDINLKQYMLINDNLGPCFNAIESGAYFNSNSYAVYSDNYNIENSILELEFEFKPINSTGILFVLLGDYESSFISLELLNGTLIMSGNTNNQNWFKVEAALSKNATICDMSWHKCAVVISKDLLTIVVDEVTKSWLATNGSFIDDRVTGVFYIGGIPELSSKEAFRNQENFHGCIRNLKIDKNAKKWITMTQLNAIQLSGCPKLVQSDQLSIFS